MDIYKYILTEDIDGTEEPSGRVSPTPPATAGDASVAPLDATHNNVPTIATRFTSLLARMSHRTQAPTTRTSTQAHDEEMPTPPTPAPATDTPLDERASAQVVGDATAPTPNALSDDPAHSTTSPEPPSIVPLNSTEDGIRHVTQAHTPDASSFPHTPGPEVPGAITPAPITQKVSDGNAHRAMHPTAVTDVLPSCDTRESRSPREIPRAPAPTPRNAGALRAGGQSMDGVAHGIARKLDFRDERMVRLAETRVNIPTPERTATKAPPSDTYVVSLRRKEAEA